MKALPTLDIESIARVYGGGPVDYIPGRPITWRLETLHDLHAFTEDARDCGVNVGRVDEDTLTVRCSWWQLYGAQHDEGFGVE